MRRNRKNKWVYSQKSIRVPKRMDSGHKQILKKMLKIDPRERASVPEIIHLLALKLESKHKM
jgi:hypothetical protein